MFFFNKKKDKSKTEVKFETNEPNNIYNPWDGEDSETNYSNVSFLNTLNNRCIGDIDDDYPRYVSYRFGIYHPLKRHIEFINNGFLVPAPPEVSLKKVTIANLKEILIQHHLPTIGKKQDLINSILQNIPIESLNLKTVYILSDKGQSYINTYQYYIDVQKYLSDGIFTIKEFETAKEKNPHLSSDNIVWKIYNEKYTYYSINFQHEMLRSINYSKYKLLLNSGNLKEALKYLLSTIYFDINGTSKFHKYSDYSIADHLSKAVHELASEYDHAVLKEVYNIADSAIEMSEIAAKEQFADCKLLILYETFNRNIFEEIVYELLNGNPVDLEEYKKYANPETLK